LEKIVVALPQLDAAGVRAELARAHVFCLPSLCENSPNSLAEAMLVGTPCVATNVGGIPSMIVHEQSGLLCSPSDPADIAGAIQRIWSDDELAQNLSSNALQAARCRHDEKRIAKETLALYAELADSGRAKC
jgi:glycosyltransferase involved in cell wall biosynthesis